jgi:Protein of unknown function (DUF3501)
MEPVTQDEVLDIAAYERIRPEFRGKVMEHKERRRVAVGPRFTFLFEDHLTVLYQVQEMVRVERMVDERAIAHEVQTYNELIPPAGGLGATLLIEYTDPAERDEALARLVGLERCVRLELDGLPPVPGRFDTRQMDERRLSSVQYVQFPLAAEHRARWAGLGHAGRIRLVVEHPFYRHTATLPPRVAAALGEDLAA